MEKPKRTPPPKKKNQAFMLKIQKFKNLKILKFSFCKKLETCHATCHVMTIKLKKKHFWVHFLPRFPQKPHNKNSAYNFNKFLTCIML